MSHEKVAVWLTESIWKLRQTERGGVYLPFFFVPPLLHHSSLLLLTPQSVSPRIPLQTGWLTTTFTSPSPSFNPASVYIHTHCAPFLHHFPVETAAAWCPTRRRPLLHLRRATSTSAAAAATARARGTDTGRRGTRSGQSSSSTALPLSTHQRAFWVSLEVLERANMDGTGGCEAGIRDRRHILRGEWTMRRFVMLSAPYVMLPRYNCPCWCTWPIEGHAAASLQMRDSSFSLHNVGHALLFCARLVNFYGPLGRFRLSEWLLWLKQYFCFAILLLLLCLFGRPSYCGLLWTHFQECWYFVQQHWDFSLFLYSWCGYLEWFFKTISLSLLLHRVLSVNMP